MYRHVVKQMSTDVSEVRAASNIKASGIDCRVVKQMSTDVSEVHAVSNIKAIALMLEAARASETSVDICLTTLQHIPEDSELQFVVFFS
jgi:hypothetical protein